jgi:hypothetical protein
MPMPRLVPHQTAAASHFEAFRNAFPRLRSAGFPGHKGGEHMPEQSPGNSFFPLRDVSPDREARDRHRTDATDYNYMMGIGFSD